MTRYMGLRILSSLLQIKPGNSSARKYVKDIVLEKAKGRVGKVNKVNDYAEAVVQRSSVKMMI